MFKSWFIIFMICLIYVRVDINGPVYFVWNGGLVLGVIWGICALILIAVTVKELYEKISWHFKYRKNYKNR